MALCNSQGANPTIGFTKTAEWTLKLNGSGTVDLAMSILQAGTVAPDFSLPDAQGHGHSLSNLRSVGLLWLTFFKVSCPTRQSSLHFMDRLARKLTDTARVGTISQDPPGHTKHFNKEFEIRLPQLFDSEETGFPVSEAYDIDRVPTTFLIDENKRIIHASVARDRAEFATMASALVSVAGLSKLKLFEPGEYVDEFRLGCDAKN